MNFPLPNLPTTVRIVRLAEEEGDLGPVILREVPVYDSLCVRFTDYGGRFPDPDRQEIHGKTGKRLWKVLSSPARAVQPQDRMIVPWGNPANWAQPLGLPNNFYPQIVIEDLLSNEITMDWVGDKYMDDTENFVLRYTGTEWWFEDLAESFANAFGPAYGEGFDVASNPALWDFGYTLVGRTGPELNYRVVQYYHAYDHCGQIHHSSLFVELECDPGERDESSNPLWQ